MPWIVVGRAGPFATWNACDAFQLGLMVVMLGRDAEGGVVRKSGVMAIVISSGDVKAGDAIMVELPMGQPRPLEPV
jgi:MOSC domain-containing protein YiiM